MKENWKCDVGRKNLFREAITYLPRAFPWIIIKLVVYSFSPGHPFYFFPSAKFLYTIRSYVSQPMAMSNAIVKT